MIFEKLYRKILKENRYGSEELAIKGEYWFDEDGSTMYADGDVGDMNHEAYVIQRCSNEVADMIGMDTGRFENCPTIEDFEEFLRDENKESEEIIEKLDNGEVQQVILDIIGDNDANQKLTKCALDLGGDARKYAIETWGWSRVHGANIEVKKLDVDTVNRVSRGIWNALEEEGLIYEDDERNKAGQTVYWISTYTGKSYSIKLDDMDSPESIKGLEQNIAPVVTAASKQLRDADISNMHPYYQKKSLLGDSLQDRIFPVNFSQTDIQMGKVWDENTVREFVGEGVKKVKRETLTLDLLDENLVEENDNILAGRMIRDLRNSNWDSYIGRDEELKKLAQELSDLGQMNISDVVMEYYMAIPETVTEDDEEDLQKQWEEVESLLNEWEGEVGYDWGEFRMNRGGYPPIVVVNDNGAYIVKDGNHRVRFAKEGGYSQIGAWVAYI